MQPETRDQLFRAFLTVNALLREQVQRVRALLDAHSKEAKYNPDWRLQPRAPRGVPEGGQWVDAGGGPKQLRPRPVRPEPRPPQERPQPRPPQLPSGRREIRPARPRPRPASPTS